ncbi:MAG: DUF4886 domain-containing protein [Candidatus Howiella sp.]|jgi:hypothetical protein
MSLFKKVLSALCGFSLVLTATLPAGAASPAKTEEPKTLRILAIGNSFSDDATQHLYQLAADCGAEEIILGNLYIGGCSLATHWSNASGNKAAYDYRKNTDGSWNTRPQTTMEYGIQDEDWDYITLQQVSGLSGVANTYNSDLDNLVNYVQEKKTNPDAKLGWHMTWAYQTGSNHGDFPRYDSNQTTMYNAITSAVQEKILTHSGIDFVIPSGTAVQNVRTSYIGDTLTRDGYHLSLNLGRYIAGLTWIAAVTGWSVENVAYVPSIEEIPSEYLPLIREAVENAVAHPYQVTESSFKSREEMDLSEYTLLDWTPVGEAYWNSGNGGYAEAPALVTNDATNSKKFVASDRRYTIEDIPVGSVIEIDTGYQYRPEGWAYQSATSSRRPGNTSVARTVVDNSFWEEYEYRAFNIARTDGAAVTGQTEEVASHFRIYLPPDGRVKSSAKRLQNLTIGTAEGNAVGNWITVTLPAKTDVTALTPDFTISEAAAVSPAVGVAQDFTSPVRYTVTAEDGSQQVYIVSVNLLPYFDYDKYTLLEWTPVGEGYWNSGDGRFATNPTINTTADNSKYFVATDRRYTKEDIPVGSVIEIDTGYQYRPDGWTSQGSSAPGRPGNVSTFRFTVEEDFWENYAYRAFNISRIDGAAVTGQTAETAAHFRVYIPRPLSDEKEILSFSIDGRAGKISGLNIFVDLPFDADLTALTPEITVSDGATVTPATGEAQDFSAPVAYTVTAEDGSTDVYTVTVTLSDRPGDVNFDRLLTVSDVVELRGLIVDGTASDRQKAVGDLDESGDLTVSDVVELRGRIVAGG